MKISAGVTAPKKRAPAKGRGPMENALSAALSRRNLLRHAGAAGLATFASPSWAQSVVNLPLPGGPDERQITTAFPQKGRMILQRTRAPLLETPFEVFDKGVFTPNDEFFVRWHWSDIPTSIDVDSFRLNVHGHVERPLSLTLRDIQALPQMQP
jgi:DMSO/TMAO reductase YedYZ molybdopterin-dependent catalytic subunit